jgi:hypothetical protein
MFFLSSSSLVIPVILAMFYVAGVLLVPGRGEGEGEAPVVAACREERPGQERISTTIAITATREKATRRAILPPVPPRVTVAGEPARRGSPGSNPGKPAGGIILRPFSRPPPVI